jgi:hypothetical protein
VSRTNPSEPYSSLDSRNISFRPNSEQAEELEKLKSEEPLRLEQLQTVADFTRREMARVYGEQYGDIQTMIRQNQLQPGSGVTIADNTVSVDPSQITAVGTLDTLEVTGSATFTNGPVSVPAPVNGTDAVTKDYADSSVVTAGTGLTKTGNVLAIDAAQPSITSVGTLSALSVSGDATVGGHVLSSIQYSVPADGETVTTSAENVILNPATALSTLTLTFPTGATNGQKLIVTSSQNVATLTATGPFANGNAPAAGLTAGTPIRFIWSADAAAWFAF